MPHDFTTFPQSYQTLDASLAKQQLLKHFDEHQIIPLNRDVFLFSVDSYPTDCLKVHRIEFVGGVEFRKIVNHDQMLIHILLSDSVQLQQGRQWKHLHAPTIFALTPEQSPAFRFPTGGKMMVVQISAKELDQHARQLIKPSPQEPIKIPLYGYDQASVIGIKNTLELLYEQYRSRQGQPLIDIWNNQSSQFLLSQILLSLNNSFTEQRQHLHQKELPISLNTACELINAKLENPFDIHTLCEEVGISQRSLQYQFKKHFCCSPRSYYQQMKLNALHRDLLAANHHNSVTELALKWGFNHSGRLAKVYQQQFGELPSQTLAK